MLFSEFVHRLTGRELPLWAKVLDEFDPKKHMIFSPPSRLTGRKYVADLYQRFIEAQRGPDGENKK